MCGKNKSEEDSIDKGGNIFFIVLYVNEIQYDIISILFF